MGIVSKEKGVSQNTSENLSGKTNVHLQSTCYKRKIEVFIYKKCASCYGYEDTCGRSS